MNPSRKTALITGASAGIGHSFAWELGTNRGYNVVLTARREKRLEELAKKIENYWKSFATPGESPSICIIPGDLNSEEDRSRILHAVDNLDQPICLLVNNAGFGSLGPFRETPLARQTEMVTVNCIAPLQLIHHFLPRMISQKKPTIINISSVCAFLPMPYMATYGATKAFLLSLGTALAAELSQTSNIRVLTVCPGPTESEFHLVAGLSRKLSYFPSMNAEKVVATALRVAEGTTWVSIPGVLNRALVSLSRIFPQSFSAKVVELMLRRSSLT